jgi:hypothetical protein
MFDAWLKRRPGGSPADVVRKNRLKELLGALAANCPFGAPKSAVLPTTLRLESARVVTRAKSEFSRKLGGLSVVPIRSAYRLPTASSNPITGFGFLIQESC